MRSFAPLITYAFILATNQEVHGFTLPKAGTAMSAASPRFMTDPSAYSDSADGVTRRDAWGRMAAVGATTASGILLPRGVYAAEEGTSTVATTTVPKVRLGDSNLETSRTIQGYWQLAGGHGRYREADALANMEAHFKAGITNMDTADIYGPSEIIVGKFVGSQPKAVPFTKFCCFRYLEEIDRAEVKERIQKACERLQVAKLPLVQFFWSNYDVKKYVDVGLWLAELKEEGLIGEIGATNFDLKRLQEMKTAGVPIVSHQVQMSALDRRPVQSGMADWCKENKVSLIAFGTVASGILSNRYLGKDAPTQEEKNTASMRMYSSTASRFGDWKTVQELLRTMDAVAGQVRADGRCADANISNIAQRYILETPAVAAVLIGVRNQDHIAENLRSHAFTLNADERDAIDKVVAKRTGPKGDVWDIERGII
jgi:aryl-alcohol dehydrogenase-like predicted oxidoreductase